MKNNLKSSFNLVTFKINECKINHKHNIKKCPYYHFKEEKR